AGNEKQGRARCRRFRKFDADTVGSEATAADAEICMMAADTMEGMVIPRGSYVVKVNNRKVLDGVLEAINLGGEANADRRLTVLRAIDKLDRLGAGGGRQILRRGRKDGSGGFTQGAEHDDAANDKGDGSISVAIGNNDFALTQLALISGGDSGTSELRSIAGLVKAAGYDEDRIRIDPSVVRGLEYYTGPVYEVELTFETADEKGAPVRFGS